MVFVPTLYAHETKPFLLEALVHTVTPLTIIFTVAPETAVPLLVTLAFSVTVEPVRTLAPLAGLVSVTDNGGALVVKVYVAEADVELGVTEPEQPEVQL